VVGYRASCDSISLEPRIRISWERLTEGLHRGARCLAFFFLSAKAQIQVPDVEERRGHLTDATVNGNIKEFVYLRLISAVDFYYIINKLIILVFSSH
jgi:hypothetical protein